jgi:hypothetical protein
MYVCTLRVSQVGRPQACEIEVESAKHIVLYIHVSNWLPSSCDQVTQGETLYKPGISTCAYSVTLLTMESVRRAERKK